MLVQFFPLMVYNSGMAKQSPKKTSKKSTSTQAQRKSAFERWLVPGIVAVAFYLVSVLIRAVYINSDKGLTPEAEFLSLLLLYMSGVAIFWWLLESARWVVIGIDRRSTKKAKSKK